MHISTISLAYYAAREYYQITREYPAGKGFADLVFRPRPNHQDKRAMVVELKWDKSAETALTQIKEKHYPDALKDYEGSTLLVGISYDQKTKKHEAKIEQA
jgi:RecB family endonuclease NucS